MTTLRLKASGMTLDSAITEFETVEQRSDGRVVLSGLADGLTVLRNLVFERVHDDVERRFGMDSMLMPVSEDRTKEKTLREIDLYQIAISAIHAQQHQYIRQSEPWFLNLLTAFRLGDEKDDSLVQKRLSQYLQLDKAERRLAFTDALVHALPEAQRAPLVLYRLFPLAAKIVSSVAFGDLAVAQEERSRQLGFLLAIGDCGQCSGRPLENGEVCTACGNPIWRFEWLTAAD